MKAIICARYGSPDVLEVREVERPIPREDEILIRVRASSLNPVDWYHMRGAPALVARPMGGWRKHTDPRLGTDFSGQVEAVGRDVQDFRAGDAVLGARHGALAEYVCTTGKRLALKPAGLTYEQAASIPVAGLTALQGLRDHGGLQPGQRVLINGAAGGVGTFAVQIARAFGAHVTGVCGPQNVDLVRSLGADRVLDYTREDFTRDGSRYDLFLDVAGNRPLLATGRLLSPAGVCVVVGAPKGLILGPLPRVVAAEVLSRLRLSRLRFFVASINRADLDVLTGLVEVGKVIPQIEQSYALQETPAAMRRLETGHARAKLVIRI
jgi:NADPH:quinone reductase-like Zn-dependent oxidoreductase